MATLSDGSKAWEVASKFERNLAAELLKALNLTQGSTNAGIVEAYLIGGDMTGLLLYLDSVLATTVAKTEILTILDMAVHEAGLAAQADINKFFENYPTAYNTSALVPLAVQTGAVAQVGLFEGVVAGQFGYNPVNPYTIRAVKSWQGNLIQQMQLQQRKVVMQTVADGLINGSAPRTTARAIKGNIGLTDTQAKAVINFQNDLSKIIEGGMRSGQSWGLYTPSQIQDLKLKDPAKYKRMNFTAKEIAGGRRWGKISRSAGTLQIDPATGVKASKPIGFTGPKGTQGGENAFRTFRDPKTGKLRAVDGMSSWRLRDKTFDPYIYDVIDADEALRAAKASGDPAAIKRAEARSAAARAKLQSKQAAMTQRYKERYLKHRSQVIARTESLRAANLGSYESMRQAVEDSEVFEPGALLKYWVSARDDRVREEHRFADMGYTKKTAIPLKQPFRVDGEAVMHPPHKPSCRCSMAYEVIL